MTIKENNTAPQSTGKKELLLNAITGIKSGIAKVTTLEAAEELTYQVLEQLPEGIELSEQIAEARKSGNKNLEDALVSRNRELFNDIYSEITLIAGIETDAARVERENNEYHDLLLRRISESEEEVDVDNVLEVFGMLVKDDSGELRFSFPEDLFPPHIREKWYHYADIVARHTTAITRRNNGEDNDVELIAQLDTVRTVAHNNLSYAIKEFLKLDNWDLEKCRRLVIKMRDSLYPTIETAEKDVTSLEVSRMLDIIKALKRQGA